MQNKTIIIHTDGACKGNPGIGAWAATLQYKDNIKEISGVIANTTNNQMELQAVIEAIKIIKTPCNIEIYTDSQYVQKGITEWIHNWKLRGWKKVKNLELWLELDKLSANHTIKWHWVRGHSGHKGNEYVDQLANIAIENYLIKNKNNM